MCSHSYDLLHAQHREHLLTTTIVSHMSSIKLSMVVFCGEADATTASIYACFIPPMAWLLLFRLPGIPLLHHPITPSRPTRHLLNLSPQIIRIGCWLRSLRLLYFQPDQLPSCFQRPILPSCAPLAPSKLPVSSSPCGSPFITRNVSSRDAYLHSPPSFSHIPISRINPFLTPRRRSNLLVDHAFDVLCVSADHTTLRFGRFHWTPSVGWSRIWRSRRHLRILCSL